jgi:hypothetical protein
MCWGQTSNEPRLIALPTSDGGSIASGSLAIFAAIRRASPIPLRGYKELTMADHSRSYENPLHLLGPCRRHRRAVAARIELPATLFADGTAPNVYGTADAAVAIVLRAVWQVPHR